MPKATVAIIDPMLDPMMMRIKTRFDPKATLLQQQSMHHQKFHVKYALSGLSEPRRSLKHLNTGRGGGLLPRVPNFTQKFQEKFAHTQEISRKLLNGIHLKLRY